jgi:G3E family GTPase
MKNFGEFYNNQIESAGTIILSRTQKLSQEKLEAAVAMLQEKNPTAAILTTPWDQLDGKVILSAIEKVSLADELLEKMRAEHEAEEAEHEHHHHDHDEHDHEHRHDHDEHEHDHEHHHHHADDIFTSWGKETPHKFTREKIESVLKTLSETDDYGDILRAKGMVEDVDGSWIYFDMVPGEYELRDGEPDYTGRLCVIGTDIDEHRLEELFGI